MKSRQFEQITKPELCLVVFVLSILFLPFSFISISCFVPIQVLRIYYTTNYVMFGFHNLYGSKSEIFHLHITPNLTFKLEFQVYVDLVLLTVQL